MAKPARTRLDVLLVARGLFESRARAQAAVMAGDVEVGGHPCMKAGTSVPADAQISVRPRKMWVSRGAEKLTAAFERFGLSCESKVCVDIGASTGGFTQVMLERGAVRVYAVDVGYGQMDARLRDDPRVVLMERTNARDLTAASIPEHPTFFVIDVSFISAFKVLPAVRPLLADDAVGMILFKPNFEARREEVKKGGLLLDAAIHRRLLVESLPAFSKQNMALIDLAPSPLRGTDGNIEYLMHVSCGAAASCDEDALFRAVDLAFSG